MSANRRRALFILNIQNDYFFNGATPIPNRACKGCLLQMGMYTMLVECGAVDGILPVINSLRAKAWTHVFVTSLQRPVDHCSFSSNHPGSVLGETITCARAGGPVVMTPDACVQGTWGAALRTGFVTHEADITVHYGFEPNSTALSIFGDRSKNVTSLQYIARELELNELYFAGVTLDGAVLQSVLDARNALTAMDLYVIDDACVASSPAAMTASLKRLETERVPAISSSGVEIGQIPNATLRLPVELPVARPTSEETYEAAILRQEEVRTNKSDHSPTVSAGATVVSSDGERVLNNPQPSDSESLRLPQARTGAAGAGGEHDFHPLHNIPSQHFDAVHAVHNNQDDEQSPVTPPVGRKIRFAEGDRGKAYAAPLSPAPSPAPRTLSRHFRFTSNRNTTSTPAPTPSSASKHFGFTSIMSPKAAHPTISQRLGVTPSTHTAVVAEHAAQPPVAQAAPKVSPMSEALLAQRQIAAGAKANFAGLMALLRSRAGGGLPSITPERLLQIAMYGTADDLENTLLRYGPLTLDQRVEPAGFNALHVCIRRGSLKMVKVLLAHGANVNQATTNGSTALLLACKFNDTRIAKVLLASGLRASSLTAHDSEQRMTPMLWACLHCNLELVRLLCSFAQQLRVPPVVLARVTNHFGHSPLMLACAKIPARVGSSNGENGLAAVIGPDAALDIQDEESSSVFPELRASGVDLDDDDRTSFGNPLQSSFTAASRWDNPPSPQQRRVITARACSISSLLLSLDRHEIRRAAMLVHASRRDECSEWSALHFSARSGTLAFVDWGLVGANLGSIDLNLLSRDKTSPLHLAAWNGQAATIASILGPWPLGTQNRLAAHIRLNTISSDLTCGSLTRSFSELDLAVLKHNVQSARIFVRSGGVSKHTSGDLGADELLFRVLLLGDGITVERLLRDDAFQVQVTPSLMTLLSRLKYPDTCTFSVAQAHNPIDQYMYECIDCGQKICLVCRDLCHPYCAWEEPNDEPTPASVSSSVTTSSAKTVSNPYQSPTPLRRRVRHNLRRLGFVSSTFCCCKKTTCRAIGSIDPREAAGFTWTPSAINTKSVALNIESGSELGMLVEKLAWNSHEVWSRDRIAAGWKWGAKRDDRKKLHPSLLAYGKLSDDDKQWDRASAQQTLAVIQALGYEISRRAIPSRVNPAKESGVAMMTSQHQDHHHSADLTNDSVSSFAIPAHVMTDKMLSSAMATTDSDGSDAEDEVDRDLSTDDNGDTGEYVPRPIDTSKIRLKSDLTALVELLSKNSHAVWAEGKRKAGWGYAPAHSGGTEVDKVSPMLVPYEYLDEKEKDMSRRNAAELVKAMIFFGYRFKLGFGHTAVDPAEFTSTINPDFVSALRRKTAEMATFKQGVADAMLLCASRKGNATAIEQLVQGGAGLSSRLNVTDFFGRSSLYWAVQRRMHAAVKKLIDLRASLEQVDGNGTGVLALAAHAGDLRICKLLVESGAQLDIRDSLGLTPLHFAAFKGHGQVVRLFAKKLTLHSQAVNVDLDDHDDTEGRNDTTIASDLATARTHRSITTTRRTLRAHTFDTHALSLDKAALFDQSPEGNLGASGAPRRPSIFSSVRLLLKRPGSARPSIGQAGHQAMRLSSYDVSYCSALDPLTLSGLVYDAIGFGFNPIIANERVDETLDWSHDVVVHSPSAISAFGTKRTLGIGRSLRPQESAGVAKVYRKASISEPSTGVEDVGRSSLGWSCSPLFVAQPRLAPQLFDDIRPSAALLIAGGKFIPRVSPLTLAVQARHRHVSAILLKFGANATKRDGSEISPYERSLLQHNLAVRVCEILRDTRDSPSVHIPADTDEALASSTESAHEESRPPTRFRMLERKNTAVALTATMLEREFTAQHVKIDHDAAGRRDGGSKTISSGPRKTVADYAQELEDVANGCGKESRWITVRHRLPDILKMNGANDLDNSSQPVAHSKILSPKKSRMFSLGSAAMSPRVQPPVPPPPQSDNIGKRNEAEADRVAAARERAREKAMRAAVQEERETNSMLASLHTSANVKQRRFMFALRTLLTEVLSFVSLVGVFVYFTPAATDFNGPPIAAFAAALQQDLISISSNIQDGPSWQAFVDYNILWLQPGTVFNGSTYSASLSTRRLEDAEGSTQPSASPMPQAPLESNRRLFEQGNDDDAAYAQEHKYLRKNAGQNDFFSWVFGHASIKSSGAEESTTTRRHLNTQFDLPDGPVYLSGAIPDVVTWNDPSVYPAGFQTESRETAGFAPMMLMSNVVVGSIRIRSTGVNSGPCSSAPNVRGVQQTCRNYELFTVSSAYIQVAEPPLSNNLPLELPNTVGDTVVDLDSANVAQRRSVVDLYRGSAKNTSALFTADTTSLSIDFTVYNPALAVFAAVRLFTYFPPYGGAKVQVFVRTARIFETRFQPSVNFEIAMGVLLALQLLQIYISVVRANGVRKWLLTGWNLYEVAIWVMFLSIFCLDISNLAAADALHIDLTHTNHFYDIWQVCEYIRNEIDLISALYYLLIIRAVRYARLIPGWGPVFMSVISTITDGAVVQFIAVLLCLVFAIGISHYVAFAGDNPYFASTLVSFESLFAMLFSQQFQVFTLSTPRASTTLYFLLWSLLTVVLQNLLIGVIGDVYQNKASIQSVEQWERHITQLMETSAVERRRAAVHTSVLDSLGTVLKCACRAGPAGGCMGCCASLRAADDSDDARDRDAPQRRRLGRVMPMPSPDDAIPAPRKTHSSRWSIESQFLPPNMKRAGVLDESVRTNIIGAAIWHDGGSSVQMSHHNPQSHARDSLRKDPGLVLFAVLDALCAELDSEAAKSSLRQSAPGEYTRVRFPSARGQRRRNSRSSVSSSDSSTDTKADAHHDSDSEGDDSDESGGPGDEARHRQRRRRHRIHRNTNSATDSSDPVTEAQGKPLKQDHATSSHKASDSTLSLGQNTHSATTLWQTPREGHLAALVQVSMGECQAHVDRGIAALQTRLQQSESVASAALARVEHVDSSLVELRELMTSSISTLMQQFAQQQAAVTAMQQQLQQSMSLNEELAASLNRQQSLSIPMQQLQPLQPLQQNSPVDTARSRFSMRRASMGVVRGFERGISDAFTDHTPGLGRPRYALSTDILSGEVSARAESIARGGTSVTGVVSPRRNSLHPQARTAFGDNSSTARASTSDVLGQAWAARSAFVLS